MKNKRKIYRKFKKKSKKVTKFNFLSIFQKLIILLKKHKMENSFKKLKTPTKFKNNRKIYRKFKSKSKIVTKFYFLSIFQKLIILLKKQKIEN